MEYKRMTDSDTAKVMIKNNNTSNPYYIKLAELEDRIENGTLIEFPYVNVKHKYNERLGKYVDIFNIFHKDFEGDIIISICVTAEEAEAKLKELQEKK